MPPSTKRTKLTQFGQGQITYKVNDCVHVRGDGDTLPYIGRIRDIWQEEHGDIKVQVAWYYRPEEALGGRKAFHGERELFKSDHLDVCFAGTIEGKCRVHNLKQYQALKHVGDLDYFARFTYKPATHEFRPDRVPVYCVCEMPYNPDGQMFCCQACEEWFHPACVGLGPEQVEALQHSDYFCDACKEAGAGQ